MKAMTATRFVGWVEELTFAQHGAEPAGAQLRVSREDADRDHEQDVFKDRLRTLDAVHTMRLPVRRAELVLMEFLSPGYDEESRIFTADTLPYEMDWTVDEALEWLLDVFHEFPWNGVEGVAPEKYAERVQALMGNRSFSVHVAAMLGTSAGRFSRAARCGRCLPISRINRGAARRGWRRLRWRMCSALWGARARRRMRTGWM